MVISLTTLPLETTLEIFSYLDCDDRCSFRQTNAYFRKTLADPYWRICSIGNHKKEQLTASPGPFQNVKTKKYTTEPYISYTVFTSPERYSWFSSSFVQHAQLAALPDDIFIRNGCTPDNYPRLSSITFAQAMYVDELEREDGFLIWVKSFQPKIFASFRLDVTSSALSSLWNSLQDISTSVRSLSIDEEFFTNPPFSLALLGSRFPNIERLSFEGDIQEPPFENASSGVSGLQRAISESHFSNLRSVHFSLYLAVDLRTLPSRLLIKKYFFDALKAIPHTTETVELDIDFHYSYDINLSNHNDMVPATRKCEFPQVTKLRITDVQTLQGYYLLHDVFSFPNAVQDTINVGLLRALPLSTTPPKITEMNMDRIKVLRLNLSSSITSTAKEILGEIDFQWFTNVKSLSFSTPDLDEFFPELTTYLRLARAHYFTSSEKPSRAKLLDCIEKSFGESIRNSIDSANVLINIVLEPLLNLDILVCNPTLEHAKDWTSFEILRGNERLLYCVSFIESLFQQFLFMDSLEFIETDFSTLYPMPGLQYLINYHRGLKQVVVSSNNYNLSRREIDDSFDGEVISFLKDEFSRVRGMRVAAIREATEDVPQSPYEWIEDVSFVAYEYEDEELYQTYNKFKFSVMYDIEQKRVFSRELYEMMYQPDNPIEPPGIYAPLCSGIQSGSFGGWV